MPLEASPDVAVPTTSPGAYRPTSAEVVRLLEAAVKAPSADNQHHFRFVVRDDGVDMRADEFFIDCDEPHRRLLTLLAFGAAAENLRLALTQQGYAFEPRWFPDDGDRACLLRIRWSQLRAGATADPLAKRIASRHTNRRLFRRTRPSAEALLAVAAAADIDDVTLHWFDGPPRRQGVLRLMRFAESTRFASPSLHAELFESVDFTAGWRGTTAEHLAPATLEVEPLMRPAFAMLRHPKVMRLARLGGAHHLLGLRAGYLPAATAPHLGALSSTLPADDAALAVGRAFQRLWLAADAEGLALQPMVASAILAWQRPGDDPARIKLHGHLRQGWQGLVGTTLPLIVFRLGLARAPTAIAGRKPVEQYVVAH